MKQFPTHIRSQGTGFSMIGLYLASLILLVAGPIAFDRIKWRFFFVLIVPTFLNLLFVYFMCPETKYVTGQQSCQTQLTLPRNRSLEDINEAFGEKVAIRMYGATEQEQQEFEAAIEADEKVDKAHEHNRADLTKIVAERIHVEEVDHEEKV